jgi:hypothetical protein
MLPRFAGSGRDRFESGYIMVLRLPLRRRERSIELDEQSGLAPDERADVVPAGNHGDDEGECDDSWNHAAVKSHAPPSAARRVTADLPEAFRSRSAEVAGATRRLRPGCDAESVCEKALAVFREGIQRESAKLRQKEWRRSCMSKELDLFGVFERPPLARRPLGTTSNYAATGCAGTPEP